MKEVKRNLPVLIVMMSIFYLSSRHGTPLAPTYFTNYIANKMAHIFWYALLCLTMYRSTKNIVLAVVLTTLFGVTDEIHQAFVPTRTGSVRDIAIDWAAASAVGLVLWKFYQKVPKILKNWLEF